MEVPCFYYILKCCSNVLHRGGSRHFHKAVRFVLEQKSDFQTIWRKIKRYRGVIQSENYKVWWKEKWQGRI